MAYEKIGYTILYYTILYYTISTPEMVKSTFRETILIICLLPGPYNMAYEKIGYTITRLPVCPFSRLLVCPFARLPVCPFARLPVLLFARLPVCPFGCLAVWPFGRSSQALYGSRHDPSPFTYIQLRSTGYQFSSNRY